MRFLAFLILLGLYLHTESLKFFNALPLPALPLSLPFPIPGSVFESSEESKDGYEYQSYQRSITCKAESEPLKPHSLEEIQTIILRALYTNKTVKAIGNLHSITDIICTDHIVLNMSRINHFSYDPLTQRATVGAGTELMDFLEKLHEHGRALHNAPSYSSITVGGALGTGAHGSSLTHPTTLSDQIFSVKFVDGRGNVIKLNATQEDFKAFRVHLGLLGIIFEVEVDTIPQYKLQMRHYPVKDEILWNGTEIMDLAEDFDVFQFWWFPMNKAVVLSVGRRIPVSQPGTCESHPIPEFQRIENNAFSLAIEFMQATKDNMGYFLIQSLGKLSLYTKVPGRTPFYTEADGTTPCIPEATGYSHRIMTNRCKECTWNQGELSILNDDNEIAVPLTKFYPALYTIREILDKELTLFPMNGIYFRFLKSSDAYVAMNSGRDAVSIEWIAHPRYNKATPKLYITSYQSIGQALIKKHGGRPHWGKNGMMYQHPEILHRVHPHLDQFIKAMETYDPYGTFMNDLGVRIRDGKNQMTVTEALRERCALTEVCVCKTDAECGDGGPFSYGCRNFLGNKVCKQPTDLVEDLRIALSRQVINAIADTVNTNAEFLFESLENYKELRGVFTRKRDAVSERSKI